MNLTKTIMFVMILFQLHTANASSFLIYSIMHEVPMGDGIQPKKNYYIKIGRNQGTKVGSVLNVYRTITQSDPYETKKRYDYNVKVGELEIIHQDSEASIAIAKSFQKGEKTPLLDIDNFMVGDQVSVNTD